MASYTKLLSKFFGGWLVVAALVNHQTANAGIPVIDGVSNGMRVAEFAQTVVQWGKEIAEMQAQYEQLVQQYQQMQDTHNSMNGSRGMGSLARSDYGYLAGDWQSVMEEADYSAVLEAAQIFGAEQTGLSMDGDSMRVYQDSQRQNALSLSMSEQGYNQVSARFESLNDLLDRVNGAAELKDIQDLQARIQGEQMLLQNEQNKIALLAQLQASQREVLDQQFREVAIKAGGFIKREGW
ncbi:type IV secretion system protein [Pseudomonas sp. Marseille-Q8238]